jgi:cholera toxin transcriptional activator
MLNFYRPRMVPVSKYRFANFEADLKAAELRRNGTRLKLQLQPFQVLVALLERPQDVVTREELRQRLWPQDTFVDFDHGLNTAMAKLRDVLGDSATSPRYVETIAKRGYRFIGEVSAVPEAAPVLAAAEKATHALQPSAAPAATSAAEPELPRASRTTARVLFTLSQIMYLVFYLCALFRLDQLYRASEMVWRGAGHIVFAIYLVTALIGVAVRLYLLTATAFDYHLLGQKYRVLFPALFVLDMLWALSPLLIEDRLGMGLALASIAALIYMPFAQKTLMKMMKSGT